MKDNEIEDSEQLAETFAINSDERCEWYLRRLANLQAEEERIKEQFARMLANLKSEQASLTGRFGPEFEAYCRERIAGRKDKKKYVDFFNARVQVRSVPARLVIESVEDALTTARLLCPSSVEMVEKFNATAFRDFATAQLEATGELLPGVAMEEARESFSVRFPKAGKGEE